MNEVTNPPQGLAAPALSKASFKPLAQCANLGEAFASMELKDRIAAAAPSHIKPGRLLQTFIGAVSKNPLLRECSVRSYIGACLALSQTGFEANTALGHAYLIPFRETKWNPATKRREPIGVNVNVIFGYPGLMDLSYRTGLVRNIHPDIVFPGDEFSFEYGSNAHLKHVPRQRREGDVPLFAYMHATLKDGQAFEVMPYGDVLSIRNKAQAYRYALEAKDKAVADGKRPPLSWTDAPWVAHEYAMARKTVVRAGSKWLPRSVELYSALAIEDAQERGRGIDFGNVMDAPVIDGTTDYLSAAADSAIVDEPPAVDPGAAFSVRGTAKSEPAQPPADDLPDAGRFGDDEPIKSAAPVQATPKPIPATKASPPVAATPVAAKPTPVESTFEAMLVDANGDVIDDELYFEPAKFAHAFIGAWNKAGSQRNLLCEYNADAIEEARADPRAENILAAIDDDEMASNDAIEVIEVPMERGKQSWSGYVKLVKNALPKLDAPHFPEWTSAQRETIAKCPMGSRVLIIRAINDTAELLRLIPPAWLGDLIKSKPAPAETRVADEGPAESTDERWVNARVAEVAAITERAQFDALVSAQAVRVVMSRLRREAPALFARADAAFTAKHNELPVPDEGEG